MPALPLIGAIGAVVGAGAAVVGTINTAKAQKRAQNAADQQFKFERQIQTNRSQRERRDAIRAARMTQGALVQTGANQGASDTSAALGGLGSITSQLNNNLSFLDMNTKLANRAGDSAMIARKAGNDAANWSAVSAIGMQIFNTSRSLPGKPSATPKAPTPK